METMTLRQRVDEILKSYGELLEVNDLSNDFEPYNERDRAMHDAELAFYEAIGVPVDVPMPFIGTETELLDAEWQLVEDEEEVIVYNNKNIYGRFGWSCRGPSYHVSGHCVKGDRHFLGTNERPFAEMDPVEFCYVVADMKGYSRNS